MFNPIKVIAIRNYQSLENVTLALGRITVIVGHSDSGKSAFMRACEQAAFNDSGYSALTVKNGSIAQKCQVAWTIGDDDTVVWERTQTTARYLLLNSNSGKPPKVFEKLGRGYVPDDITSLLGFISVTPDPNAPPMRSQFVGQFDLPFLVGDRGGVASARLLSRLTGLHVLSFAQKKIFSVKNEFSGNFKNLQERVANISKELSTYDDVDAQTENINNINDLYINFKSLYTRFQRLLKLKEIYSKISSELDYWQVNYNFNDLSLVKLNISAIYPLLQKYLSSVRCFNLILNINIELSRLNFYVGEIPSTCTADELVKSWSTKVNLLNRLNHINEVNSLLSASFNECDLKYRQAVNNLSDFELKIPLCPFISQFPSQSGTFRCKPLMSAIRVGK